MQSYRTLLLALPIVASVFLCNFSFAAVEGASQSRLGMEDLTTSNQNADNPQGLWFFAGTHGGYLTFDTSPSKGLQGRQFGLSAGINFFTEDSLWIHSALLGIHNSYQNFDDNDVNSVSLNYTAHYNLQNRWSAGPSLIFLMGSGSKFTSSSSDLTGLIGGGVFKDMSWENQILRFGGTAHLDMNIPEKTVMLYMLTAQIGFGSQVKTMSRGREVGASTEMRVSPLIGDINFSAYSSKLSDIDELKLRKLALVLKANKDLYSQIRVRGHADASGPKLLNDKLSIERAQTARKILIENGLSASKVGVEGRSELSPKFSNTDAMGRAKNRRVEIYFENVNDPEALKQAISEFM